jgi:hypothetical protein
MTPRQRRWLFFAGIAIFLAFYLWGLKGLPGFGNYPGPYGFIINRIAVAQTHATGVVSAVNFEYRGFDTVGEEFILFVAATGVATVLRHMRGEREETASAVGAPEREAPSTTDAIRIDRPAVRRSGRGHGLVARPARPDQPVRRIPGRGHPGHRVRHDLPGRGVPDLQADQPGEPDSTSVEAVGAGGFAAVGVSAVAMGLPYLNRTSCRSAAVPGESELVRHHRADQLLRRPRGRRGVHLDHRRAARADAAHQAGSQ